MYESQMDGAKVMEFTLDKVPLSIKEILEKSGEKMQRLIDMLEDLDDVLNIYHNWEE